MKIDQTQLTPPKQLKSAWNALALDLVKLRADIKWHKVKQHFDLHEGKVFVITGGAKGLGKELAWWIGVFGGGRVIFCDTDPVAGKRTEQELNRNRQRLTRTRAKTIQFVEHDVTKYRRSAQLIEGVVDKYKKIDVLINNAGIGTADTLLTARPGMFDRIYAVNVKGAFNMSQPFVRYVDEGIKREIIDLEEKPKLVTMGSIGGVIGLLQRFSYGVSKHAAVGLTDSSIVDLGRVVDIIGINPCRIATDMPVARINQAPEEKRELIKFEMSATQRNHEMLKPSDLGATISYITSSDPGANGFRNTQLKLADGWPEGHQLIIDDIPTRLLRQILSGRLD